MNFIMTGKGTLERIDEESVYLKIIAYGSLDKIYLFCLRQKIIHSGKPVHSQRYLSPSSLGATLKGKNCSLEAVFK